MIRGPMKATLDDFDSVVELISECFPWERDGGGLVARWPHIYIRRPEEFRNRFIIKDDDKVISHVGVVDQTLLIDGKEIKVAGVTDNEGRRLCVF